MAASENQGLLPDYLYRSRGAVVALAGVAAVSTPSACGDRSQSTLGLGHVHDDVLMRFRRGTCFDERVPGSTGRTWGDGGLVKFMIPGASETRQTPLYTKEKCSKGASNGRAVSDIGTFNLFTRGSLLQIFMIGTLTGVQWGIYDVFKTNTGGAAPARAGGGSGKKLC